MELLTMLVLIAGTALLILWPLFAPPRNDEEPPAPPPETKSRAALLAIKELEFDFATGKIAEDDYLTLRRRYEARAVEALQAPPPPPQISDDDLEAEIRAARSRRLCASCAAALPAGARYCPSCGAAVGKAAAGGPPVAPERPVAEGRR
ncbi:MAG: hypothetical protein QN141_03715 [Armatimonadota bacterium]|nr:hypothetical protein [Armatimonadota bacterium]MDR7451452.1 hypothetical protein [Armatimonadota bacterium]MDR7466398.1 hypothetical protein [Armatimonadota bacterium]MDR7493120.1 hypothetical protein [Armatimonadota bacterium]MDR7498123.1 hypothetical protein [Armatimonadota bacterium]